jgi:hypothetical protein
LAFWGSFGNSLEFCHTLTANLEDARILTDIDISDIGMTSAYWHLMAFQSNPGNVLPGTVVAIYTYCYELRFYEMEVILEKLGFL